VDDDGEYSMAKRTAIKKSAQPTANSGSDAKIALAKEAFGILLNDGGWTREQACGIVSNIEAESGFDANAIGDGGTAFGLCQWHPDRQRNFRSAFGHDIHASTYDEQVRFIDFELLKGTESSAGKFLKAAQSADEAGRIVSLHYERPNDPTGSVSAHRGQRAEDWLKIL
jgi:hypothetical protein